MHFNAVGPGARLPWSGSYARTQRPGCWLWNLSFRFRSIVSNQRSRYFWVRSIAGGKNDDGEAARRNAPHKARCSAAYRLPRSATPRIERNLASMRDFH